jgi:lysophospholipase L1-like esterase
MQSLLLPLWITMGVSSLARFGHDVIAQPRVSTVILMMGINDIGWTAEGPRPGRQGADQTRELLLSENGGFRDLGPTRS